MRIRTFIVRIATRLYQKPEPIACMLPKNVMRVLGVRADHTIGYQLQQFTPTINPTSHTDQQTQGRGASGSFYTGGLFVFGQQISFAPKAPSADPRIGYFYLELNNRRRPVGQLDVGYLPTAHASHDFMPVDIPVERGSMLTGLYVNESAFPSSDIYSTKYIASLYLKCLVDDDGQDIPTIIQLINDHHA